MNTRQRITSLYAYDTETDARNNTNGTEYTSGIVDGSQRYEHTVFSSLPGFGEANAAMYECEIAETTDLTGKWIRVKYSYYATDSATTLTDKWFFLGQVDECRYDKQRLTRKLVAYDKLYQLRSVDISAWWLTYWASASGDVAAKNLVVAMCSEFGVAQAIGSSIRNDFTVYKAAHNGRNLGGCTFTDILRFVGQICGVYWAIDGGGQLVFYALTQSTATSINNNIDTAGIEIGDTDLATYGTMTVYDGADVIYTSGTAEPVYTFSDNILLYGRTTAYVVALLNTTKGYLSFITGLRPATIPLIVAEESFLGAGRFIVSFTDGANTRTCFVSGIECSGPQLIDMTVTCTGDMVTGTQYNQAMNKTANDIQDIGVQLTYKVNADGVIEAVNAEASETIKILARALDINGIVTANNNFKINSDGSMETIAGKLANWIIGDDMLYKTITSGGYEYRISMQAPASPTINSTAFCVERRTAGSTGSYTKVYSVTYGGKVESKDFVANGRVVIHPDYDLQEAGVYAIDLSDNYGSSTVINPDFANFANGAGGGVHIDQSEVKVESGLDTSSGADDATVTLENYGQGSTGIRIYENTGANYKESYMSINQLKVNNRDLLKEFKAHTQYFATEITSNSDLKTTAFLNAGRYYCRTTAIAQTLSNCPVSAAFCMDVDYPISTFNNFPSTWGYCVRTITVFGGEQWIQYVGIDGNGTITWESWQQLRMNYANGNVFKQIRTNDANDYQILFTEVSGRDSNTQTARARKQEGFYYNPASAAVYIRRMHSATATNGSSLLLGNATADGTAGASYGILWIYGKGDKYARFQDTDNVLTANRTYQLPNKDGELAILQSAELNVGNRNVVSRDVDAAKYIGFATKAGGTCYLHYSAAGNHGILSSGYESSLTDATTYTAGQIWVIERLGASGKVVIPNWSSKGSSGRPVYFDSTGFPTAVTETSGEGTLNTTNARGYVYYWKQGKVVTVSLYAVAVRTNTVDTTLFTGLPAPSANFTFGLACETSTSSDWGGVALYLDTSGNIKLKKVLSTNSGKLFVGSFTYLSAS